ncbi:hypothetical protein ABKN59_008604 [Abortiporus biennis]
MSVTNISSLSPDPWDVHPQTTRSPIVGSSSKSIPMKATVVPDDWDAEEEDESEEEQPQKLWEDANQKAPMPELVISSSSTGPSTIPLLPQAAFQPTLRILKRPPTNPLSSNSSSSSSSSYTSTGPGSGLESQKSYAEREAEYQAARERIFGGQATTISTTTTARPTSTPNSNSNSSSTANSRAPSTKPSPGILRSPRGPYDVSPDGSSQQNAGFGNRRRDGSSNTNSSSRGNLNFLSGKVSSSDTSS